MARTHVDTATEDFGGAPFGATKRLRGVPTWVARTHVDTATGACGAPLGATKRMKGVPTWVARTHVDTVTGAFCGVPYGPRSV
eukprot:30526-Pyramimonas_sp.AAC.1